MAEVKIINVYKTVPAGFPWMRKTSNICMKSSLNLRNVQVSFDIIF